MENTNKDHEIYLLNLARLMELERTHSATQTGNRKKKFTGTDLRLAIGHAAHLAIYPPGPVEHGKRPKPRRPGYALNRLSSDSGIPLGNIRRWHEMFFIQYLATGKEEDWNPKEVEIASLAQSNARSANIKMFETRRLVEVYYRFAENRDEAKDSLEAVEDIRTALRKVSNYIRYRRHKMLPADRHDITVLLEKLKQELNA